MEILEPSEPIRVKRKSSIYQHRDMLAVRRGDEWVPIAFDVFDGMTCKKVYTHKAVLSLKPYIGYNFPVQECRYVSQTYVASDQKGVELLKLPNWYGAGFYQNKYDRKILVNSDTGSLGVKTDTTLRVGEDYCLAVDTIDSAD